jgi:3-phosphoshikimate 1-carboxyvinyltransferase
MGIHRLYNKESNRLLSTCALLDKLGVSYEVLADAIQVRGGVSYKGDIVDSFDDHRIVLASYVARLLTKIPIVINDTRSIKKSYPTFVGDL